MMLWYLLAHNDAPHGKLVAKLRACSCVPLTYCKFEAVVLSCSDSQLMTTKTGIVMIFKSLRQQNWDQALGMLEAGCGQIFGMGDHWRACCSSVFSTLLLQVHMFEAERTVDGGVLGSLASRVGSTCRSFGFGRASSLRT